MCVRNIGQVSAVPRLTSCVSLRINSHVNVNLIIAVCALASNSKLTSYKHPFVLRNTTWSISCVLCVFLRRATCY